MTYQEAIRYCRNQPDRSVFLANSPRTPFPRAEDQVYYTSLEPCLNAARQDFLSSVHRREIKISEFGFSHGGDWVVKGATTYQNPHLETT